MTKRNHSILTLQVATVLLGLLFAVLPLHAADSVHIEAAPDARPVIHPDIMNGLVTSDYPAVGVILEGPLVERGDDAGHRSTCRTDTLEVWSRKARCESHQEQ